MTDGPTPLSDLPDAPEPGAGARGGTRRGRFGRPGRASRSARHGRGRRAGTHFASGAGSPTGPGGPDKRGKAGRRRRWPRRLIISLAVLVVLAGALVVSGYVYARVQYDSIKKVVIHSLTKAPTKPGAPFDLLLVGSDSRQFVDNGSQENQFGSGSVVTGQRSDVIIIARVVPATHKILMLSIPRDTWVDIPGNVPDISGMNRVNAAFNSGPDLLVQTIQKDFGIPVNHYVEVNFAGFSNIVNALGGIYLDFSTPVYDTMSGLKITQTGCQLVNGAQSLSLVRSRDEYYETSDGTYDYDGMGDWSRIRRQDAFFRAVIARVDSKFTNPIALNDFISATVKDLTIDSTFSEGDIISLAREFHGLGQNALTTEVLPTAPEVLNGADVLLPAEPYDQQMIRQFLAFGTTAGSGSTGSKGSSGTTTTTQPSISPSQVSVEVLNGNGESDAAGTAASQLETLGFSISATTDASSFSYTSNEIEYGPDGLAAAKLLQSDLQGGATLKQVQSLQGSALDLTVGSAYDGVKGSSSSSSSTTTTEPSTPESDVVFDNPATLPEPWDPTPCNP